MIRRVAPYTQSKIVNAAMNLPVEGTLNDLQRGRLERFAAPACVDIHCHCLPGLDDGPETMAEALALCRALADDGVTIVIATPHQLGRYDGRNDASKIRRAVSGLNAVLLEQHVSLKVVPGADVRLDERIPTLLDSDQVLPLGDGGKYLLLEQPSETLIDLRRLVVILASRGITAVVSHPERHTVLVRSPQAVLPWLAEGAVLQLTAGSLIGDFGPVAEQLAWHWLSSGQADLVATDAHNTGGRAPRMSAAIDAIAERLGHLVARRVCIENPARVLGCKDLIVSRRRSVLPAPSDRSKTRKPPSL